MLSKSMVKGSDKLTPEQIAAIAEYNEALKNAHKILDDASEKSEAAGISHLVGAFYCGSVPIIEEGMATKVREAAMIIDCTPNQYAADLHQLIGDVPELLFITKEVLKFAATH